MPLKPAELRLSGLRTKTMELISRLAAEYQFTYAPTASYNEDGTWDAVLVGVPLPAVAQVALQVHGSEEELARAER